MDNRTEWKSIVERVSDSEGGKNATNEDEGEIGQSVTFAAYFNQLVSASQWLSPVLTSCLMNENAYWPIQVVAAVSWDEQSKKSCSEMGK